MTVETTLTDSLATLTIEGSVDTVTAPQLEEAIKAAAAENYVLDFTAVDYISSAGLRVLIATEQTVKSLVIKNINEEVKEVFEMTGFDQILTVE